MHAKTMTSLLVAALLAAGCGGTVKSTTEDGDTSTDTPTDETGTGDPCEAYPDIPCVVLEHEGEEQEVLVDFHVEMEDADFYLLIDTTGTMDGSIADVAASFTPDILPAAEAAFGEVRFGLGHFNDFPTGSFGQSNDMPFWHMLDVTDDFTSVQTELDTLPDNDTWGNGQDWPESNTVALAITATGTGLDAGGAVIEDQTCTPAAIGYPCFRPDALPVVLMVSDAPWHNDHEGANAYDFDTYVYEDAVAAFIDAGIKFLGVHIPSGDRDGLTPMETFATDTGSVDADDAPLVSTGTADTTGERAAGLIDTLREQARFDVSCTAEDDPGDDRDATDFVVSMEPDSATPPTGMPDPTYDGITFYNVMQGTDLTFRVTLQNTDHPSETEPVESSVWIVAMGGATEIGRERIVVFVP
jgi:hypothetical protein